MKSSVSFSLLLRPFKWLRKIRGFRLVYTPLIAIVIFTAVMGVILGTLQLQEKNQQESALFRELSIAKQRIQLRFVNNLDALVSMNRELAASEDQERLRKIAYEQAADLVSNNHEIIKIIWIDGKNQRPWTVPLINNKTDWINRLQNDQLANEGLVKAIELSRSTNRASFSQFIDLSLASDEPLAEERKTVFWQVVPNIVSGDIVGYLAALYTTQGILNVVPPELKAQYRFTLLTDNERLLAISSDRDTPRRAFTNQTSLDIGILSPNLILRIDTYPPPTNLTFRMLIGVVIGLCAFVIWWFKRKEAHSNVCVIC